MKQKPHILVVDDDDRLRALLKRYLTEQGYAVSGAEHTEAATELCRYFLFDLIILDEMMPGTRGTQWLKEHALETPVLMLSALGETEDKIRGLEHGAEDYLSKPFEPKELLLRMASILRRTQQQRMREQWVAFGDYRFDPASGQLRCGDRPIHLTGSEQEFLKLLTQQPSQIVSRERFAQLLPEGSNERSVDVQMSRLRKKIETGDGRASYLQTVRGAGYMLYVD